MHLKKNYNDFKENWGTGMDDKEKIEAAVHELDTLITLGVFSDLKEHDPEIAEIFEQVRRILTS